MSPQNGAASNNAEVSLARRTVQVIDALAKRPSWSLKALSRETGLPKSSLHRLLKTLESEDYVKQEDKGGMYSIGSRLVEQSGSIAKRAYLQRKALGVMCEIYDITCEDCAASVVLDAILHYGSRTCLICLEHEDFGGLITAQMESVRFPMTLHAGATGKVLLAFMSEIQAARFISSKRLVPLTSHTTTSSNILRDSLRNIKTKGFCVSQDDWISGVTTIAAPVVDEHGNAVAALGIAVRTRDLSDARETELIDLVSYGARQIASKS